MTTTTAPYPFVRDTYLDLSDGTERPCWRPGVEWRPVGPDSSDAFADGMGTISLTEVGRYKPPGFPERVFYTRKFTDPDGKVFGKNKLHIASAVKFKRLCNGYAHEFEIDLDPEIHA